LFAWFQELPTEALSPKVYVRPICRPGCRGSQAMLGERRKYCWLRVTVAGLMDWFKVVGKDA